MSSAPGRRARRRIVVAILLALVAVGFAPTAFVQLTTSHLRYSVAGAPTRPVALVMGAWADSSGRPGGFLEGRLQTALELYRAGKVKVILVSGDNSTVGYDEPDAMRNWLVQRGVPAGKVVADYAGFDTYASCVRAKQVFGVDAVTVVSQDFHLPRAVATCRAVGLDAIGVGDSTVSAGPPNRVREVAANWKMVLDVTTRRVPLLGPHETSVEKALAN